MNFGVLSLIVAGLYVIYFGVQFRNGASPKLYAKLAREVVGTVDERKLRRNYSRYMISIGIVVFMFAIWAMLIPLISDAEVKRVGFIACFGAIMLIAALRGFVVRGVEK